MEISSFGEQMLTFLFSFIMGIVICLWYDFFRIIRLCHRFRQLHIFIQDILFWAVSALLTFFLLMARYSGELRSYVFVAEITGFIICRLTLSRLIMKISGIIVKFAKRFIRFLGRKLYYPLRRFFNRWRIKISINIKSACDKLINSVNNVKKGLKHRSAVLYNQHISKKNKKKTSSPEG
ncbi:MAG TPA: spore cortex biosynthesis protein YabQ [Firmicutes bacterium]|nr:spore cortex biosynthesis protein YabQ [Bacillota bacterium]